MLFSSTYAVDGPDGLINPFDILMNLMEIDVRHMLRRRTQDILFVRAWYTKLSWAGLGRAVCAGSKTRIAVGRTVDIKRMPIDWLADWLASCKVG